MLIGVFIYSWWIAENSVTPHACFGLCIVASIGAIVTGVLFIVWYRAEVDLNALESVVESPTAVQMTEN